MVWALIQNGRHKTSQSSVYIETTWQKYQRSAAPFVEQWYEASRGPEDQLAYERDGWRQRLKVQNLAVQLLYNYLYVHSKTNINIKRFLTREINNF